MRSIKHSAIKKLSKKSICCVTGPWRDCHRLFTATYLPAVFGPNVEAHATFPEPGVYYLFGEFKHEGKVLVSKFAITVE